VTVHLKDVPKEAAELMAGRPFVAFSLLQHEHKKSVVHFTIQRNTEYEDSVRSKVSKRPLFYYYLGVSCGNAS
jgi:pre-rRNA-processing protein TSR1